MTTRKKRPPAALNGALWRFSDARQIIAQDIVDGIIPLDDDDFDSQDLFENLWSHKQAFANFPYDKDRYDDRIKSMQRQVKGAQDWAFTDHAALMKDRLKYPVGAFNCQGKPRWDGSDAQRLLKIDLANEKHLEEGYAPKKLWLSRPAYKLFGLTVFRKHIDQQKQANKPFPESSKRKKANAMKLGKGEESRLL